MEEKDIYFMKLALKEAEKAFREKEIPVGCVIVYKNEVIAKGFNKKEKRKNPLGHAEIIAIDKAARRLGKWRLTGTSLYVTLEPCPMCAGAMVQARINRLIYGAKDPKTGAVSSLMNLTNDRRLNHQIEVKSGILEEDCSLILKRFFNIIRNKKERWLSSAESARLEIE